MPRPKIIFPSRVERAAAEFIGSQAEANERAKTFRVFSGYDPTPVIRKAERKFGSILPGSTPRLRKEVINLVKRRTSVGQARARIRFRLKKEEKRKKFRKYFPHKPERGVM